MLAPRSCRFFQAALQSGLIAEADLLDCWDQVEPERRTPEAIDRRLARQAINAGKLSLWQAQQLLTGRTTGFQIEKYQLINLLGRGGMGRVFLARDTRLNRLVALKLLSQERMTNTRAIARFRREAKVGAQLQHENLVRIYDEGEAGGIPYLVMEYIDGKNVGQLIGESGQIPWPTAARLARQVALGLEHARLKGLIHRDVNPCNILVTQDGTAKLTDLGLAIDLNDVENVTRDGATVGTFDYIAPEQARNSRAVDTRADLYSLGCTLYHMLAGRVPFPVTSLPEKLYAHQLHDPDPLPNPEVDVPEGLAEVVRHLMRKLPEERYQTPGAAAQALEPFALAAGWSATPSAHSEIASLVEARSGSGLQPILGAELEGESSPRFPSIAPANPLGVGVGIADNRPAGDSYFPLDLGPAEPLGGSLHSASRSRSSATSSVSDRPARALPLGWAALVGLTGLIVIGVVASLASLSTSRLNARTNTDAGGGAMTSTTLPSVPPPLAVGDFVIRFRDGTSTTAPNFRSALAGAVRDRGEVILAGGKTVRLTNESTYRVGDGSLTIRGPETGPPPTIEVTLNGSLPALLVTANLRLVDLNVVVRGSAAADVPAWQAERDLTCERCTFRAVRPGVSEADAPTGTDASPPAPASGSGLGCLLAEGPRLTIRDCLFVGFGRPVEFAAAPNGVATVSGSIFLNGDPSAETLVGPALVVRSNFGGGVGVRLQVEDSSARSEVFLAAEQFGAASPLAVEVARTAVWANALLELNPTDAGSAWPDAAATIQWRGRANRYHFTPDARPWARRVGGGALAEAPATLDAWSTGGREVDTRTGPLRFRQPPTAQTDRAAEFALVGEGDQPVGADAQRVGPKVNP